MEYQLRLTCVKGYFEKKGKTTRTGMGRYLRKNVMEMCLERGVK